MPKRSLGELAALTGAALEGDAALELEGVAGLESAGPTQLSFFANPRYKQRYLASQAGAVIVGRDAPAHPKAALLRVDVPTLAFARVAQGFEAPSRHQPGIAAGAFVEASARVDPSATVMAGATVGAKAIVGARAVLYPGVFVGDGAQVGDDSVLRPNVVVAERCVVGARCLLHPGAVVGADGFGFAFDLQKPGHVKIPQLGIARLEDDVELGACACVDRATTGETVVGQGAKIDNLVQVGHNCVIGPHAILCAQVGLSGTTSLGTGVVLAGQVGTAGHLHIGDGARIGAQAGVVSDVEPGVTLLGSPAIEHRVALRSFTVVPKLPELAKTVRALERRLEALEKKEGA